MWSQRMWHALAMLLYDVYNVYGSNCTNVVQYLTILHVNKGGIAHY